MRRQTREFVIVLILILVSTLRYFYFLPTPPKSFYDLENQKVEFSGIINTYPDKRENQIRLTVRPRNFKFNILVPIYEPEDEFHYGDILKISGTLTLPESFDTDTGKTFDYGKYLIASDTFFIIKNPEIEKIGSGGKKIKRALFSVRERFEESLFEVLPIRDAGFIDGLILGAKGGINDKDEDAFIRTGTIHIVALSGFNVMIVAEAVMRIVQLFAYGALAYASAGVMVTLFVILSGAGATAVRAGIMASIALLSRASGRTYMALRALVIASLLMLVINPRIIFDVSFHLSVIATFGVITLPVKLLKYFMWIPGFYGFRQMVLATVSASIAVIPYIIYVMGNFSVVSLITNILILPIVSPLMLLGFLSGFIGIISPALALPVSYITHVGNNYLFSVVHFFSSLPFANLTIQKFPLILVIIFYVWLLWWALWQKQASQK